MPRFARDILQTVVDGWRECGDVVRFRGLRTMTLAAHPDSIERVMEERQEIYPRSDVVKDYLAPLMGKGLFTSEGELWQRQRRTLEPLFASGPVARFGSTIAAATDAMLQRWEGRSATVDMYDEMRDLSLAIMERVLFGRELDEGDKQFRKDVITAVEYVSPRVMSPVNPPEFLPPGRRYKAALRRLDAAMELEIAERSNGGGSDDLLTAIVAARDPETGDGMSVEQARDEAMTAIFGAYKGLPGGLTWIWYLLAQNSDVWDRVAKEVESVVGDREPRAEDVDQLSYLRAVIDEVLRLYPPLWIWSRPPVEEDELGGYSIPKGMFVLCIPYVTHRHPDFWDRPEEFDAERFAGTPSPARHPHAYFPFASGPRRCTGEAFSLLMMPLVVALVTRRYRMRLEPGYSVERALEFFLRPSNGLPVTVEPPARR